VPQASIDRLENQIAWYDQYHDRWLGYRSTAEALP
jgi:hypothetical protein